MKRTTLGVAVLALTLVGCAKNEVREANTSSSNVITFDLLASRASVADLSLMEADANGFVVYGISGDHPGGWYAGVDGTYNHVYTGSSWGWEGGNNALWPADASGYPMKFHAWYPAEPKGLGAVNNTFPALTFSYTVPSNSDQDDLLAGTTEAESAKPALGRIPMLFNHILSKVDFGINAGAGYTAYVQLISVENVSETGTYHVIDGHWSDNDDYSASYTYYNNSDGGQAKIFTGNGKPQPFYTDLTTPAADDAHLMLMPQHPSAMQKWNPATGSAVNDLDDKTHIKMLYRLEKSANPNYVGYAQASNHPDYAGSDAENAGYDGPLFVLVAYPYLSEWIQDGGYTYSVALPGLTGGYLIDEYYYRDNGSVATGLAVERVALLDPITSAGSVIGLIPDTPDIEDVGSIGATNATHASAEGTPTDPNIEDAGTIGQRFKTFDIKVGVNLSQWFLENYQRAYLSRVDLERIAGWGFDHVRIPMGEYVMFDYTTGVKKEDTWELVKTVLGWCDELNLRVVLDYHTLKEGEKTALHGPAVQERFYQNWRVISGELNHYSNGFLAYEILNEMTGDAATWNMIAGACIEAIRELEPERPLVLGGVNWNDRSTVNQLDVPVNDPNIILTFHQYWPQVLTHYKASWGPSMTFSVQYPGRTVPISQLVTAISEVGYDMATTWGNATVNRTVMKGWLTAAVNFAQSKNLKLWCGEYGCIGWTPKADRVSWLQDSASIYEELGIAHCVWEYAPLVDVNDSFSIFCNGVAKTDEINAILGK